MSSWRLQRCCFCSSLRFGSIAIGSIFVVVQLVAIVNLASMLDHLREKSVADPDLQRKAFTRYLVLLVLAFLILVLGLSTILATLKKFALFLKANAGVILVITFLYTAMTILREPPYSERLPQSDPGIEFAGAYVWLAVEVCFNVYFSVVLWSYALELEDESLKGYTSSRISN